MKLKQTISCLILSIFSIVMICSCRQPTPDLGGIDRSITGATALSDDIGTVKKAVDRGLELDNQHSKTLYEFASALADVAITKAKGLSTMLDHAKVDAVEQIRAVNDQADGRVKAADKVAEAAKKRESEERDLRIKAEKTWGYKFGQFINRALFWIAIAFGVAIVSRVISLIVVNHPIGKILAGVSTALFAVLSLGMTIPQTIADNLYFRKLRKQE